MDDFSMMAGDFGAPRGTTFVQITAPGLGLADADGGKYVEVAFAVACEAVAEAGPLLDVFVQANAEYQRIFDVGLATKLIDELAVVEAYWNARRIACAKAFVSTLGIVSKALAPFEREGVGGRVVRRAAARLKQEFPHLRDLRNSVQHLDERARGRKVQHPPSGGGQVLYTTLVSSRGYIDEDAFCMRIEQKGEKGKPTLLPPADIISIPVTRMTLQRIAEILQAAANEFAWTVQRPDWIVRVQAIG